MEKSPLYILMISIHGLIRGNQMELGRDADTGGQITYVIELAKALGRRSDIARVDLATRLIDDPDISADYSQPEEHLSDKVRIIRVPFGPRKYLRKEALWPHLDQMVDRYLHYLRQQKQLPDVIHTHYADAGYVGQQLSQLLGIPLIHTGHSLGRCKRQRLVDSGRKAATIDRQFHFPERISAEENVLAHASLVVTSTRQEIRDQYGMYENFNDRRAVVIPPGTDTTRFSPSGRKGAAAHVAREIDRFLEAPEKPLILAIARPDMRKNLHGLITAFGEHPALRDRANLAIIAGNREDIRTLEESQQKVLNDLLLEVDRLDLYGKVALPKRHAPDDIPEFYRLAQKRRGVFVNPALTEPFGLTLIEAAASGLPIVATEDGGPRDIIANCRNGLLIDPLDRASIAEALHTAVTSPADWKQWSKNGLSGVRRHYTWDAHVAQYLKQVKQLLQRDRKQGRRRRLLHPRDGKSPMPLVERGLISDIDNTLIGDREGAASLVHVIERNAETTAFGIATGRPLESAVKVLREWKIPVPDVLITSVGSEIHYGPDLRPDTGWARHIRHQWRRDELEKTLGEIPGLMLQSPENQREFKLSYNVDPSRMPGIRELQRLLRERKLHAKLIYSHGAFLDILPVRASKGLAIRYLAYRWGLPLRQFLVAGDSGNDAEMLSGDTLGVVVGNFSEELAPLRGEHQVYFAGQNFAWGILEGIQHYGFVPVTDELREQSAA